jgi:lysozyme
MLISQKGTDIIKRFEGLSLTVYKDVGGLLTVGWGHRTNLPLDSVITLAAACELLSDDLSRFETGVSNLVKVPVSQGQFDALCSFSYNVGLRALENSHLLKKLNAGISKEIVAAELLRWDEVDGQVVPGILRRRQEEEALFLS